MRNNTEISHSSSVKPKKKSPSGVLSASTKFFAANASDLTQQKKLEKRKDEFISIASHELKTPLTTIKGLAQILQKNYGQSKDKKLVSYIDKMNTQLTHLQNLVASLLDVSVIQTGKMEYQPELLEINSLVKEAVESIQIISETHQIILRGQTQKKVVGDRYRINQVLINLLTNAMKYSPLAKKVVVEISDQPKKVIISVQDFGVGISEKHLPKIFHRFFRSVSTSKYVFGLGLGLYISAGIIRRHKGKIWAESQKGKGSTFFFSLPVVTS